MTLCRCVVLYLCFAVVHKHITATRGQFFLANRATSAPVVCSLYTGGSAAACERRLYFASRKAGEFSFCEGGVAIMWVCRSYACTVELVQNRSHYRSRLQHFDYSSREQFNIPYDREQIMFFIPKNIIFAFMLARKYSALRRIHSL